MTLPPVVAHNSNKVAMSGFRNLNNFASSIIIASCVIIFTIISIIIATRAFTSLVATPKGTHTNRLIALHSQ